MKIRTNNWGGFCIFLMTISFLWFGIFVIDYFCILYWFEEPVVGKRLISVLPITNIGTALFIIFNALGYLSTVAHLRASLEDPGIVTEDILPPSDFPKDDVRPCKKWDLKWKPMRAHHCSECKVCIFKMDHHCPWINSCVGIKNTKYFFLFTLYTGIGALLAIAILVTSFILLMQDPSDKHINKSGYPFAFFLCVWVLIESILFSFFTLELVGEQIESFQDNQTYVDDLKDLIGIPLTLTEAFKLWIGEDWHFWWAPTKPVLKLNYWERLYKMQEIISRKYQTLEKLEYDPTGKMKAISEQESSSDRLKFLGLTVGVIICAYFTAAIL